jgi:SAM-dependent methyltransferase
MELSASQVMVTTSTYTLEDQARMSLAKNYFAWQGRLVTRELGRRVIEVGCGIGNFTRMLLDRDLIVALDIEPGCVEKLRERYPNQPNLRTFVRDAGRDGLADLAALQPDSCVCLNVLEHIEDDLGTLQSMASALVPAGVVVLLVPAFHALYGPIDKNLGHYRRYTKASMAKLARAAGLQVQTSRYMNMVGFFGWWANARLFHREAQSEAQIETFDKYIVPVMSRMEDFAAPPFGQSLFAVLRKP